MIQQTSIWSYRVRSQDGTSTGTTILGANRQIDIFAFRRVNEQHPPIPFMNTNEGAPFGGVMHALLIILLFQSMPLHGCQN